MPKIRILQKGLLLVFVPMLVGITFILCLYQGLLSTDKMIRREMRLKDAAANFVRSNSCMTLSETFAQFYTATRGEIYRMEYNRLRAESVQAYSDLKRDLKGETDLHVPPFDVRVNYLMVGTAGSTSRFLTQLQERVNEQTEAALASVDALYLTLYLGLSVCVVSSLILAVFFCLNITNRLLLIVNNTRNLSIGKALNAPLEGSDEIAELDQFLFDAAAKIQELERFKKEMIGVVSHELKSPLSSEANFGLRCR